jgi:hypothetical protein
VGLHFFFNSRDYTRKRSCFQIFKKVFLPYDPIVKTTESRVDYTVARRVEAKIMIFSKNTIILFHFIII